MTFPSDTGNEELSCEIRRFLMSCHLSLLLAYIHPVINCFDTSVSLLMSKNQNVDQKWGSLPKNYMLPVVSFWIHQQEAGRRMTSFTRVPCWEKGYHEDVWWAEWGTVLGNFWGWEHLGILECFLLSLLLFFFSIFWLTLRSPKSVILQREFLGAKPPATSP